MQLGTGDYNTAYGPGLTNVLTNVASIVAGSYYTCALMIASGGVRCWGSNGYGQLGTGNTVPVSVHARIFLDEC